MKLLSQGGLGNQLFFLNFAHQLKSENKKKILLISRSEPALGDQREFEIGKILNYCTHDIKSKEEDWPFDAFNILDRARVFKKSDSEFLSDFFNFLSVSNPFAAPKSIKNSSKFVRGYFQSAESVNFHLASYFQEIVSASQVSMNPKGTSEETEKYQAIHIRRGDFIQSKQKIGLLALPYYKSGVEKTLPLKIVTDGDLNFIKEIKAVFPESEIYGPQEKNTWEAFNLLFHASHLQIANSTFSWWAGALATFKGADVIAPNPWNLIPQEGIENLTNPKFHYRNAVFE